LQRNKIECQRKMKTY